MNKLRLLALATLCMTGVSMANPAVATGDAANNPVLLPLSDSVVAVSEKQSVDSKLLVDTSGISDETWLLFAAMLALAGIVIVHKTSH